MPSVIIRFGMQNGYRLCCDLRRWVARQGALLQGRQSQAVGPRARARSYKRVHGVVDRAVAFYRVLNVSGFRSWRDSNL